VISDAFPLHGTALALEKSFIVPEPLIVSVLLLFVRLQLSPDPILLSIAALATIGLVIGSPFPEKLYPAIPDIVNVPARSSVAILVHFIMNTLL
jgi:hypothetical protein